MSSLLRSLLIVLAAVASAAKVEASPKPPPAPKPPPRPPAPHIVHKPPHLPAPHPVHMAARHLSATKVTHHRRPAVHRHPVPNARRGAARSVRQPGRQTMVRRTHRYPVHRVQRRFVRRPYYVGGRNFGVRRRYTYSYYPGRYLWRTSNYNLGYGVGRRRGQRGIAGIVESVQGIAGNGTLVLRVVRPRSSRFRYARTNAGAGWGATSLHRFRLNNGTLYHVMTAPPRGGTIADLHKGEHVLVLTHTNTGGAAHVVQVSPRRRR
ncbi:MAG TPA: hypothetical protein VMF69_00430 [Gemmataceae bacterium]|nr:hypothetical protein [Gemmataceae bacterium]